MTQSVFAKSLKLKTKWVLDQHMILTIPSGQKIPIKDEKEKLCMTSRHCI